MRLRLPLLIGVFTLAFLFIGFNVYNLQIEKGAYYTQRVSAQNISAGFLEPARGTIYFTDKNGSQIPVAINHEASVIYAVPKEIVDAQEASGILSPIVNIPVDQLTKILSKPNDLYERLVQRATTEQAQMISDAHVKGVYIDTADDRFYPFGGLAAHVLGFTSQSEDDQTVKGKYGLESYYQDLLVGRAGSFTDGKLTLPVDGQDIYTTIDRNVQAHSEEVLDTLMKTYKPISGMVIVQEPSTGKILAMAAAPGFDPNEYGKSSISHFLNPMVQAVYEPGSIFKVITMAIGLDAGKITPQTSFNDTGELKLNGKVIRNWDHKAHGNITMTEVIEQSVNTGAAYAQKLIGRDTFYDYLVKFGFKEATGIDLPGETVGKLTPLEKNKQDINFATASFGQGVSVTPIRLISAISAIANHGVMVTPYVNERSRSDVERRVISAEAAEQTVGMMVSAVKKAKVADIPQYDVAGKTGTAQIPDFVKGGYIDFEDGLINTYVGFAPAYDPKFTILLRIDKPEGATLAGQTVVPAFHDLAQFLLNYYNVAPSH